MLGTRAPIVQCMYKKKENERNRIDELKAVIINYTNSL